jgi:5-amino-6-(5-phosphoribosylamino)uracil reductase
MRETWGETLEILNQKGFSKIALLGGTKLITSLLLEDKIDELQITFVPRILTGKYSWTSVKIDHLPIELSQANTWVLEELKDIGGSEVLLKYVRNRT